MSLVGLLCACFYDFEGLGSQKWVLVYKIKSFYKQSALSFSDFQLLHCQKSVLSPKQNLFLTMKELEIRKTKDTLHVNPGVI